MKRHRLFFVFMIYIALIAFGVNSVLAKDAKEKKFQLPEFEKYTLANGLTVYLMEQHEVPMIYLDAVFPGGAIYDNEKEGLASLTAEALIFDTKSYTKSQIEETFDFYGASLNTSANKDMGRLNASFASKNLAPLMKIIKEVITEPKFSDKEFEKRKQRALVELKQAKESPRNVIGNYFNRLIFSSNPYGNAVQGTLKSVKSITNADLKKFYKTYYQPGKSAIAVVGDFKKNEMKALLNEMFGQWKGTGTNIPDVKADDLKMNNSQVVLVNKENANETTFMIGGPGIKRNNPDFVAIEVINTILGGRFTSWLNDELRVNAGYTYGARSYFSTQKAAGTFVMSTYTKTKFTEPAIDLALKVLERLHNNGIDQKTLESAKNYVKGQYPPDYETSGQLADLLVSMYVYGFDEEFINSFEKNVDSLTLEKANEIVKKYFPKDNLQFVLVGKASEIKNIAAKYGKVIEKDINQDGY